VFKLGIIAADAILIDQSLTKQYISATTLSLSGVGFAAAVAQYNNIVMMNNGLATTCTVSVNAATRTSLSFSIDSGLSLLDCGYAAGDAIEVIVSVVSEYGIEKVRLSCTKRGQTNCC